MLSLYCWIHPYSGFSTQNLQSHKTTSFTFLSRRVGLSAIPHPCYLYSGLEPKNLLSKTKNPAQGGAEPTTKEKY